jgi:sec-independent protein translocase protein TatA
MLTKIVLSTAGAVIIQQNLAYAYEDSFIDCWRSHHPTKLLGGFIMLGNIGLPTLLFIVLIALLLFGPNKLPELGRAMGKTLREFKNGAKDVMGDEEKEDTETRKQVNGTEASKSEQRPESKDDRRLPE